MMCFVTHNNKSDLHIHSGSLVFVPFDGPCMISIVTMSASCTVFKILSLFPKISRGHVTPTTPTRGVGVVIPRLLT